MEKMDAEFRQFEGPHLLSEHTRKTIPLTVYNGTIEFNHPGGLIQLRFNRETMIELLNRSVPQEGKE